MKIKTEQSKKKINKMTDMIDKYNEKDLKMLVAK